MNNSIVKLTFYVLAMFLVSDCSAVAAKKQKSKAKNTEEHSAQSNENDQFVQEANERIVDNKIDNAVQTSSDNSDELVLLKSKVKYLVPLWDVSTYVILLR